MIFGRFGGLAAMVCDSVPFPPLLSVQVKNQVPLTSCSCICIHELQSYDKPSKIAAVSLKPLYVDCEQQGSSCLVFHPGMFPTQSLLKMMQWTTDVSGLYYNLDQYMNWTPEQRPITLRVLQLLFHAPQGVAESVPSGAENEVLRLLLERDLIQGPPWKLTMVGEQCVQVAWRLQNPRPVLGRPRGALADASLAELILQLEHESWEQLTITSARQRRKLMRETACHVKGDASSPKRWYIYKNVRPSTLYLRALLEAKPGSRVPHLADEEQYCRILELPLPKALGRRGAKSRASHTLHAELAGIDAIVGDDFAVLKPAGKSREPRRAALGQRGAKRVDPFPWY